MAFHFHILIINLISPWHVPQQLALIKLMAAFNYWDYWFTYLNVHIIIRIWEGGRGVWFGYFIPQTCIFPQDSKSHHERELKAAEAQVAKSRKEAERVTKEAGSQQQAMQTLQLEVEEMEKSLATQQQQVCRVSFRVF